MAQDVSAQPAPEQPLTEQPAADRGARRDRRGDRARSSGYRLRFGLLYVALAAVLGAGVGAFVVLAARPEPDPDPPWSPWRPNGSETAMLRQIADRIPQSYKQNGTQLTVSTASRLAVPTEQGELPIEAVFVQPDTSRGLAEEDDIDVYEGNNVASFSLCGVGNSDQCAITAGKPSTDRFTFLRRQALELSLYTLKYVDGFDSVLVFMPPTQAGESNGTIFLTRNDLAAELRRPVTELLPTRAPTVGGLTEVEEGHVLRLTEPRTYAFQFQAAPNGSPILVLSPPTASGA